MSDAQRYFDALYFNCQPDDGEIFLLSGPSKIVGRYPADRYEDAARYCENNHVDYIKYNLQDSDKVGPGQVGKKSTVSSVIALGLDVDANKDGFADRETTLDLLDSFRIKPTLVVNTAGSTGGFHVYYCLTSPAQLAGPDDPRRDEIQDLFKRIEDELREHLGNLDATSNLDRLLRPAGTINTKYGEPVTVLHGPGEYHDLSVLRKLFPEKQQDPAPFEPAVTYQEDSVGTRFNQDQRSVEVFAGLMASMGYDVRRSAHKDCYEFNRPGSESSMANGRFGDRSKNGNLQLVCWSPNTPFELNKSITIFQAYADLLHGGDLRMATGALGESLGDNDDPAGYVEPAFVSRLVSSATRPEFALREGNAEEFKVAETIDFSSNKVVEIPEELMADGGWLEDCASWIKSNMTVPLPELAFGAALHLLSLGAARKWRDSTQHQTCGNLYTLAVAATGTGKETQRRCVKAFLHSAGCDQLIGPDALSSGPGLAKLVETNRAAGCLLDEIGDLVKAMCSPKAESYMSGIAAVLKVLYTSSSSPGWKGSCKASEDGETVAYPHLSLIGSTTPGAFFSAMSTDKVTDGLLGRFTIFHASVTKDQLREAYRDRRGMTWIDHPQSLEKQWKLVHQSIASTADVMATDDGEGLIENLSWRTVPRTPEAEERFAEHDLNIRLRNLDHEDDSQTLDASLWARANEKTAKFALLFAISRWAKSSGASVPMINLDDMNRAIALSNFLVRRMIQSVKQNLHESETDGNIMKLLSVIASIQKSTGKAAAESRIYRRAPLSSLKGQGKDQYLIQLAETQGYIRIDHNTRGKGGRSYSITEDGLQKLTTGE